MKQCARPPDGSGNVPEVQVRIGATVFDLQRRPLVIALLDDPVGDGAGLVPVAKEAAGQGADLVALPAATSAGGLSVALDQVGVGCVGVAGTVGDFEVLTNRQVTMILWEGSTPIGPLASTPDRPAILTRTTDGLRRGDGFVVAADRLADLDRIPHGVMGIVDLSTVASRAAAAALVTVALEQGAVGFLTAAPSSVRRAAHVIRAVEHAE